MNRPLEVVARTPDFAAHCSENACHSERREESCLGLSWVARLSQSKIPRFARNDIVLSWFPGVRQAAGMADYFENDSPPLKEEGAGVAAQQSTTPRPSLSKEGNG